MDGYILKTQERYTTSQSGTVWDNASNLQAADNNYATKDCDGATYNMVCRGFDFDIPTNSILDTVTISVEYNIIGGTFNSTFKISSGNYNGSVWTTEVYDTSNPQTDTLASWTHPYTLTIEQLNSDCVFVGVEIWNSFSSRTFRIDYIKAVATYYQPLGNSGFAQIY